MKCDIDKLKPCPFCAGSVTLEEVKMRSGTWYGIKCRNNRNLGGDCAIEQVPSRTPEAAISRWNMRKPEEELHAQLSQCEAMAMMVAEREWAEHVGTGPVSSKVEVAFTQLHNELQEAQGKVAEAQALLCDIANEWGVGAQGSDQLWRRISAVLSVPSALECHSCLGTGHAHSNGMPVSGTCTTCNGLGTVPDGEITGHHGVEFENGPVECVRDCPDCIPDFTPGNGNKARRRAEELGIDYDAATAKKAPKG